MNHNYYLKEALQYASMQYSKISVLYKWIIHPDSYDFKILAKYLRTASFNSTRERDRGCLVIA